MNFYRKRGVLNEENIAWLEQVFRENVGKGKEEFTLDEFKKIVPSRNVRTSLVQNIQYLTPINFRNFLWRGHSGYLTKTGAELSLSRSLSRQCTSFPAKEKMRKFHFFLKFTT